MRRNIYYKCLLYILLILQHIISLAQYTSKIDSLSEVNIEILEGNDSLLALHYFTVRMRSRVVLPTRNQAKDSLILPRGSNRRQDMARVNFWLAPPRETIPDDVTAGEY